MERRPAAIPAANVVGYGPAERRHRRLGLTPTIFMSKRPNINGEARAEFPLDDARS